MKMRDHRAPELLPATPPLAGITVIDWTHVLAGPFATYQLALLGARVIRVEQSEDKDVVRGRSEDARRAALRMGDAFVMMGAGKESLAVDVRNPEVRAALRELIGRADVLVENFRPGRMAEFGFSPAELIERHPKLIVCSISGFGQRGPNSTRPAYDHIIQAMSGLMAVNADEAGRPQRIGAPLIDYTAGRHASLAILAALLRREREQASGRPRMRGEWLDVAMFDSALTLLAPTFASRAVSGSERKRTRATAFSGNPLSGTFATRDDYIALVCNTTRQSEALLAALRTSGASDEEMEALAQNVTKKAVDEVHAALGAILLTHGAAYWEDCLIRFEVPVARVSTPWQAYEQAVSDTDAWPRVDVAALPGRQVAVPGPGFSSTHPLTPALGSPPLSGEQSRDVLRSLGLDDAAINRLCDAGSVRASSRAGIA